MSDANQLYSLLQIGTSRAAGVRAAALPPELDALVPAPLPADDAPGEQSESRLWQSLAAWSLWTRAGRRPPSVAGTPPPAAAPEHLRSCPPGADALLARLLQGGRKPALLREWLRELARHGGRLPARFLPNLLTLGTRHAELRNDVVPVLGERGQWLARFDPDWAWAVPAEGQDERIQHWETGSIEQRIAALTRWRAADPGAARDALAQAWASEAPEARARLLACLSTSLGPEDEAFLEGALDDRRKEVRLGAQVLLVKLPGSALRRRMAARAEGLVQIRRPLPGQASLEVSLPESVDKAMVRDGVGAVAHPGLGEKAGWLVDLLAATDPRTWTERFGAGPADLLLLASRSDFAHALVRGWSSAVVRGTATPGELANWVHALLVFRISTDERMRQQYPRDFFDLFARISPAELHAWLAGTVAASRPSWGLPELALVDLLVQAATRSSTTWPAALSREVVERLLRELPAFQSTHWELRSALDSLASVVDPPALAGIDTALSWGGAPDNGLQVHIANFFDTVRFRHEMSLSFQESA